MIPSLCKAEAVGRSAGEAIYYNLYATRIRDIVAYYPRGYKLYTFTVKLNNPFVSIDQKELSKKSVDEIIRDFSVKYKVYKLCYIYELDMHQNYHAHGVISKKGAVLDFKKINENYKEKKVSLFFKHVKPNKLQLSDPDTFALMEVDDLRHWIFYMSKSRSKCSINNDIQEYTQQPTQNANQILQREEETSLPSREETDNRDQ